MSIALLYNIVFTLSVLERKCESVNITVPQRNCQQVESTELEVKCHVTTENVTVPVCVEVVDKEVEEVDKYFCISYHYYSCPVL